MFPRIKRYLFGKFLKYAPKKLQVFYYRKKILIPTNKLYTKYLKAIQYLKDKGDVGDYLEFGVFRGASLLCMYRALKKMKMKNVRLFGFDSFDGLPDSKNKQDKALAWLPGSFRSSYQETRNILDKEKLDWGKVFLIKGWFSDTLNNKLAKKYKLDKVSLIMIDCDLYSSAKQALDFCLPFIKDKVVIFFDDWDAGQNLAEKNLGEKRAFDEFLKTNSQLKARAFGAYYHTEMEGSPESKIFLVTKDSKYVQQE